jgi:hypothetical protein
MQKSALECLCSKSDLVINHAVGRVSPCAARQVNSNEDELSSATGGFPTEMEPVATGGPHQRILRCRETSARANCAALGVHREDAG